MKPSEYCRRQVYGTFWFKSDAALMVDEWTFLVEPVFFTESGRHVLTLEVG